METKPTEPRRIRSVYACACYDRDRDEIMFVTFQTRNEEEAKKLATCINADIGPNSLVIINEEGDIHFLD